MAHSRSCPSVTGMISHAFTSVLVARFYAHSFSFPFLDVLLLSSPSTDDFYQYTFELARAYTRVEYKRDLSYHLCRLHVIIEELLSIDQDITLFQCLTHFSLNTIDCYSILDNISSILQLTLTIKDLSLVLTTKDDRLIYGHWQHFKRTLITAADNLSILCIDLDCLIKLF